MSHMHPEMQYLDLVRQVLTDGAERNDRTETGTRSIFGAMAKFDLRNGYVPLLTTKKVFWRTAIKEMLWFLSGSTRLRALLRENVRIWSDWPYKRYTTETGTSTDQTEFERRILGDDDFDDKWGDLGPIYGKQWRRWSGPDGREHDQITTLIDNIRTTPHSRRLLFHGWNVSDLNHMTLPPCHMVYQYYVANNELSCTLYQRSADLMLGVPFNWIEAVALQKMIAQQCHLELGDFIWFGGDVHIYRSHVDEAQKMLTREPTSLPSMSLERCPTSIDGYRIDDFKVTNYHPHDAIDFHVAV